MSTPINLNTNIEKIIIIRPIIAEVSSSWPALSLSGFPEEVIIIKLAERIKRKATPPPIPTAHPKMNPINSFWFPKGTHPIAVLILVLSGQRICGSSGMGGSAGAAMTGETNVNPKSPNRTAINKNFFRIAYYNKNF